MSATTTPRNYSSGTRILVNVVNNLSDVECYHAKVMEHIHSLEDEIRVLKGCYNAVTPTCCLPPEILSNIFLSAVASTAMRERAQSPLPWARITHVCRHWRSVALDCPRLWTHLQFASPLFTEAMLQRSRAAPLTVKVPDEGGCQRFEPVLSLALSQLNRLRVVEFSWPYWGARRYPMPGFTAISQWKGYAPILESLVLDSNRLRPTEERLPLDWMPGKAPKLRVLSIRSCGVSWETAPLGGQLTRLTLQEEGRGDAHRTSVEGFIASLTEMPLLRELHLEGFAPRVPASPYPIPNVTVTMPSLTNLDVNDSPKHISLFFRVLRIPTFDKVEITFSSAS